MPLGIRRPLGILYVLGPLLVQGAAFDSAGAAERHARERLLMGSKFVITLYADDAAAADAACDAAFARVAALNRACSDYDSDSELTRLCAQAPTSAPVPLSDDLFAVLERAEAWHKRSEGAFDITLGPLTKLWRRARRTRELPSAEELAAARAAAGHRHLKLDRAARTATLSAAGMRLDLGGIAKGHAAQEALAALRARGVASALVDAGGDLALGAPPPGESGWKVGVAPRGPAAPPGEYLLLANRAIATSGDAWQHLDIDGARYSHILDPATGLGLTTRCGVTAVAADGADADALATALCVLGPDKGLALVETLPDVAALFVSEIDGEVVVRASKRFQALPRVEKPR